MGKINVAIIGVGNCASSLVQGVHFYRDANEKSSIPGLMHPKLGDYHVSDINFVAAFDIDANKVGKDLAEAIYTPPNNTFRFADVPLSGIRLHRGMTHDGLGKYLSQIITKAPGPPSPLVCLGPSISRYLAWDGPGEARARSPLDDCALESDAF